MAQSAERLAAGNRWHRRARRVPAATCAAARRAAPAAGFHATALGAGPGAQHAFAIGTTG